MLNTRGGNHGQRENRQVQASGLQLFGREWQRVLQSLLPKRGHRSPVRRLRVRAYGLCYRGSGGSGGGGSVHSKMGGGAVGFCDVDLDVNGFTPLILRTIRPCVVLVLSP